MKKRTVFFSSYLILFSILLPCTVQSASLYEEKINQLQQSKNEDTIYYVYQKGEYVEQKLDIEPIPLDEENYKQRVFGELVYPLQARENGVQGIVLITVILDKFGDLVSSKIKRGIGKGCDEEALKAVKRGFELGFEPAFINGNAVKVKYDIPINFRLE